MKNLFGSKPNDMPHILNEEGLDDFLLNNQQGPSPTKNIGMGKGDRYGY